MKTINLFALALLSLGAAQQAAAGTWQFSYTGFYHQQTQAFDPNYAISGSFSGTDTNHNNVIDANELTGIEVHSNDNYLSCGSANSPYYYCGMSFGYNPGTQQLYFNILRTTTDPEGWRNTYTNVQTGVSYVDAIYFPWRTQMDRYDWTDQTVLSISGPGPVPEPGAYAMLLGGLALLACIARRKRG
ncbi:PEP-CTERM sorting domain-containing protein [Rugamonas rivuli]|uniref:PEP-CTERM sorting domain-containing protein n=1 Tax=Rugamonas rivuli TaxID=2743358 RepID=A0A843S7U9_9BURK|nr:PEP-CTERM sorting domain-containing protein [Rugamonas rivuli]MQA18331.1 PEP-CTERM sorting domain-containing protein [Rugamonas rivuli]